MYTHAAVMQGTPGKQGTRYSVVADPVLKAKDNEKQESLAESTISTVDVDLASLGK